MLDIEQMLLQNGLRAHLFYVGLVLPPSVKVSTNGGGRTKRVTSSA